MHVMERMEFTVVMAISADIDITEGYYSYLNGKEKKTKELKYGMKFCWSVIFSLFNAISSRILFFCAKFAFATVYFNKEMTEDN